MNIALDGQVAIVTGASSGIGKGVARALALAGAKVAVNFNSKPEPADELVRQIEAAELALDGGHLGNFPQALTHLALISAAFFLDRELGGAPQTWRP